MNLHGSFVNQITASFSLVTEGYESSHSNEDASSELLSFGFEVVFIISAKYSNIILSFRILI
jgi:hypothetical protein